jgi:hypothetical protein
MRFGRLTIPTTQTPFAIRVPIPDWWLWGIWDIPDLYFSLVFISPIQSGKRKRNAAKEDERKIKLATEIGC